MSLAARVPKKWPKVLQSWIGGQFLDRSSGDRIPCVSAVTGEPYSSFECAGSAEIDLAVAKARDAQIEWARRSPTERGRILRKAADILNKRNDELALLETLDTSRPIQETNCVDIVSARDAFEYYSGIASMGLGEYIPQPGQSFAYTVREPLGVTCGIGAWNYPIQSAAWKSAPALACGNSIVYKPAEDTPLTALALGEVLQEAGLPDGLYNVVLGARTTGELLAKHTGISKVSFTGSVPTGVSIIKNSADTLKKVQMELGGKSPLIVCEDANLEQAVSAAMMANWYSSGQVCSNGTRVFVHASIKQRFVDELVRRTKKLVIGDPFDPKTQMGPLVSHKHLEKVLSYVEIGKKEGAKLVYGGERVHPSKGNGAFMTPAIFDDCSDKMRIVKEEIFGPVAAILSYENEKEVIARANDTSYGLSAGVFTRDIQRGHRLMREISAGTTWINNYNLAPAELPWQGHKMSGIGSSNGTYGVADWTQVKSVYVEMGSIACPYE